MKKTLYKDIKECNIKLIIIIGLLFIMFSGYTSYSIFTDEVVSNNVITVKVGKKRYTLTINQTSEEILTCTNNTTGECSTTSLQVAKDESVSCTSSIDSDYTVLLLELNNDSIGEETFTYNYEENNTITPTYVKKTPDYCFATSGNSITGYNCYEGNDYGYETITDVVIPSEINGTTITRIDHDALSSKGLTSVDIPDTVTWLSETIFSSNNLKVLKIPSSISSVKPEGPFCGTTIEKVIFKGNWIVIPDSLFRGAILPSDFVIPDGVTEIGKQAFQGTSLTSIIIPNGVTTIGDSAFVFNNLTSVIIPSSVTIIGGTAFFGNSLTSVKIKGKSSSSDFTTYGTNIWGWASGYSDSNIEWNYTE